jgi:hypothetical protein
MKNLKELVEGIIYQEASKEEKKPTKKAEKELAREKGKQNLDKVMSILKSYNPTNLSGQTLMIKADDRPKVIKDLMKQLEPLGWTFNPSQGTSVGQFEWKPEASSLAKPMFLRVKSTSLGQGALAAKKGSELETNLADQIKQNLEQKGLIVSTAGFGHGSDLTIQSKDGNQKVSIEIKTTLEADFGQLSLAFNTTDKKWMPINSPNYEKNKQFYQPLVNDVIKPFMDQSAKMPSSLDPSIFNVKGEWITGLKANAKTAEMSKLLQSAWFGGHYDKIIEVPFEKISNYYALKGDDFIQIENLGLYALSNEIATQFQVPYFGQSGLRAFARIRIKPEIGPNGRQAFNVAIKLRGKINKSNVDLSQQRGQALIAKKINVMKENEDFDYKVGDLPPVSNDEFTPKADGTKLIATLINPNPDNITFTSKLTEKQFIDKIYEFIKSSL